MFAVLLVVFLLWSTCRLLSCKCLLFTSQIVFFSFKCKVIFDKVHCVPPIHSKKYNQVQFYFSFHYTILHNEMQLLLPPCCTYWTFIKNHLNLNFNQIATKTMWIWVIVTWTWADFSHCSDDLQLDLTEKKLLERLNLHLEELKDLTWEIITQMMRATIQS